MSSGWLGSLPRAHGTAIPLTVIGGFLGAGKTTLLNAVLARSEGRRLAILVNDFGTLSIDAALISARSARTLSLSNGCVCCTLVGGLTQALIDVLEIDPPPDHVVVEASGVSDPGRIAQIARADRGFAQDATIVVAAADQIEGLAADRYIGDTLQRQLASADLIVLNKRDLVGDRKAAATLSWLHSVSPGARLIEAVHGELPCGVVLGHVGNAGTMQREGAATIHRMVGSAPDHGDRFSTRTLRCAQPLSEAAVRDALAALPEAVLRAKGFVRFDAAPDLPHLVQAVGRRWSISAAPLATPAEGSMLVIIGVTEALAAADLTTLERAFSGAAFNH